jgi:hypothetical protein
MEETQETKAPELSTDQKNAVLLLHRDVMAGQLEAIGAKQRLDDKVRALNSFIHVLQMELQVSDHILNLDTLQFIKT